MDPEACVNVTMPVEEAEYVAKLLYITAVGFVFVLKWMAHSPSKTQATLIFPAPLRENATIAIFIHRLFDP